MSTPQTRLARCSGASSKDMGYLSMVTTRTSRKIAAMAVLAIAGGSLLLLGENHGDPGGISANGNTVAHWSSSSSEGMRMLRKLGRKFGPFRRIYRCGVPLEIQHALFPDHDGESVAVGDYELPKPNRRDLLIASRGLDFTYQCVEGMRPWLIDGEILSFPGKMMFFQNEPADTQAGPRPIGYDKSNPDATNGPTDACAPGPRRCIELQETLASQVPEFEKPGGRFNYLPPSDRAYIFGPHPDTDRSIQLPLVNMILTLWGTRYGFDLIRYPSKKVRNTGEHFAVFFASHCVPWRDEAAKQIAQIGELYVGQKWMETCAERISDPEGDAPVILVEPSGAERNAMFQNNQVMNKYKFAVAMEDTYREGYITEKIMNAFLSGAVPIWYGGKNVAMDIFNPESFIFYDVENPQLALDRIRFLKDHPDEYQKMLDAPILRDGERTVEKWFSLRDDIGGGKLKHRIRKLIGVDSETDELNSERLIWKAAVSHRP